MLFILVAGISTTLTVVISLEAGAVSVFLGLIGCWLYHALTNDYFAD